MNSNELEAMADTDLVSLYAECAVKHGAATEDGDHEEANANADVVAAVFREMRRRGTESKEKLVGLLENENLSVQCWAATHSLETAPKRAQEVLERLANISNSFIGLDAEMTLEEWRAGRLKFP